MRIKAIKKIETIVKRLGGIIDLTGKDIEEIYFKERNTMKAPEWFKEWSTEFEKKNDARWDQNDARWDQNDKQWKEQTEFNGNVSKFIEQQLKFNNDVSKFMENQMDFNANQVKFNENQMDFNSKIMLRLDNIVSQNNLTE